MDADVVLEKADRRGCPRRSVISRIQLFHDRLGQIVGTSINISDAGLLVLVDEQSQLGFPAGSYLKLSLLDSLNPDLRFNANVVRSNHQGLALRLLDYEYHGTTYPLQELRRQWYISQSESVQ